MLFQFNLILWNTYNNSPVCTFTGNPCDFATHRAYKYVHFLPTIFISLHTSFLRLFFLFFFFSFSRINLQCQSPMEYSISKSVMSWALAVVYICCVALLSNNNNGVQASHQVFKEQQFISPLATKKELRTGYHFQPSKHWINGINLSFFMPYTSTLLFMTWSVSFFACARGGW